MNSLELPKNCICSVFVSITKAYAMQRVHAFSSGKYDALKKYWIYFCMLTQPDNKLNKNLTHRFIFNKLSVRESSSSTNQPLFSFADLLQLVKTACSTHVDNKFWQSACNEYVDNWQQTCRQHSTCSYKPCEHILKSACWYWAFLAVQQKSLYYIVIDALEMVHWLVFGPL